MSDRSVTLASVLAWAIAAFSIITGIIGLLAWDSDSARVGRGIAEFFGQENSPIALIIAILQISAGIILFIASLGVLKPGLNTVAIVLVIAFWLFKAVIDLVLGKRFQPDSLNWWKDILWYLVIILAIWQTRRTRD